MATTPSRPAVFTRVGALAFAGLVVFGTVRPVLAGQAPPADDLFGKAQEQRGPAGSLRTALAALPFEAVRVPDGQSRGGPPESHWSRVGDIVSGTELTLTLRGVPPGVQRYFVAAADAGLTVLNVADPELPPAVRDVLRKVALEHPGEFLAAAQGQEVRLGKDVRMGPAGVFAADHKVADLSHVLETIARDDIGEITTHQKGRGFWGHLGGGGGMTVGIMSGGMAGGLVSSLACQAALGRDRCDTGAALMGAAVGEVIGGIAGGAYGHHAARRETEVVIYRAAWLASAPSLDAVQSRP